MGASTVSSGWSNHFIEFLKIFDLRCRCGWPTTTGRRLRTAENVVARQMAPASDPSLVDGHARHSSRRVGDILSAQSPELVRRAHELVNAPTLFGVEIRFQSAGIPDRADHHGDPGDGHPGERHLQRQRSCSSRLPSFSSSSSGHATTSTSQLGPRLEPVSLPWASGGIGAGAAYIFFAYIGFDAVSTTAQEAKNPQRDLPIGIIASLVVCTILYILVAAVLTGMVPWKEINIEAPLAVAFLDRGLTKASYLITAGALAGLTSVMLVMLLGQTRVLYSMANDGLLPRKFFAAIHPKFRTPYKNTILVGLLAAIVGSVTPIDDIGRNGEYRHAIGVRHRLHLR